MRKIGLYTLSVALVVACTMPAMAQEISATLHDLNKKDVGTVRVTQAAEGSLVRVELNDISEGWHGIHFHEKGLCNADQKFADAGAHAAVTGETHGAHSDHAAHAGDLPNVYVGKDGIGKAEFLTRTTTAFLIDADGSSFMVHAKPDDYKTQPSGDSGDRIACGVLKTVEK